MTTWRALCDALATVVPAGHAAVRRTIAGVYLHWSVPLPPLPRARLRSPAMVLDLETTGLTGDTPLFLVGLLERSTSGARLHQLFAPTPAQEAAVLQAARRLTRGSATVLSYNGSAFDFPYLHRRAAALGVERLVPTLHIDVLPLCRRAWRGLLPRFRLVTVEAALNGGARTDDLPSARIPEHYNQFVRTGDPRWVVPIFQHNARDLVTTWKTYCRLERGLGPHG